MEIYSFFGDLDRSWDSFLASDETRVAIICLASLAFLLSLIIGVPEIEIKQKVSSVEEEA